MVEKHFILALLWALFCFLHSLLASLSIKQKLAHQMGKSFKHYRLFYTLFAFATLGVVVYYQINMDSPYIYHTTTFSTIAGIAIGLVGLVIMAVCIKKYFLSLSGLKSLFQEKPATTLMLNGIHRFVRHPLYAGTFIAIWGAFIALPLLSLLIANFIITVYTLIGIELEEKKLEAEFGAAYKKYQQKVPKLIPALRPK
jgi:methanethiol S-methyltransferase